MVHITVIQNFWTFELFILHKFSAANRYYSSSGHHEQKVEKNDRLNKTFGGHNKTT